MLFLSTVYITLGKQTTAFNIINVSTYFYDNSPFNKVEQKHTRK